jgi:nitrite reductase/ring-hydroxylating ferredoxin subunit
LEIIMSGLQPKPEEDGRISRRSFVGRLSTLAMLGGLIGGYGTFAAYALRYLYPPRPTDKAWLLVSPVAELKAGASLSFRTPSGAKVAVARQGEDDSADSFIALGSTCPHLGCQVHWEAQNKRFFCPCHNGIFDPSGKGIGGPPGEAGQSLPRYPLKVENGLLYIEVPSGGLTKPEVEES